MPLYERLFPRFRPKRELRPRGSGAGWRVRIAWLGTAGFVVETREATLLVDPHHDAFFAPLERGVHLLPGIDLDGFFSEVSAHAPRARGITPDYEEPIRVPPEDARGAVLAAD